MTARKLTARLKIADFKRHPVWEFDSLSEDEDSWVRPVLRLPVRTLNNRVVMSQLRLADGTRVWALLSNLDPRSKKNTDEFLALSLFYRRRVFHLARSFDPDYDNRSPERLADFLRRKLENVFPISWDLTGIVSGVQGAVSGSVRAYPKKPISRKQLIQRVIDSLALP